MEFRFECKVTAMDMWKLSMSHIYHNILGVYNAIFAVAIILLTIKFWDPGNGLLMGVLLFACLLFPVIQPIAIYLRAIPQVSALPKDMVMVINDTGLHITAGENRAHVTWNRVKGTIMERNMIILAIEDGKGYMLTNKVLGTQKEALVRFVESKLK